MKIIHISPTYAPVLGRAELHMKALSEGLVSRGHHVTVLTANARIRQISFAVSMRDWRRLRSSMVCKLSASIQADKFLMHG